MNPYNQRGVTLIEVMIGIAIAGIIFQIILSFYIFGSRAFNLGEVQSDLQNKTRIAARSLTKELRYAKELRILPEVPDPITSDWGYIFVNDDSFIEYRDKDSSRIILNGSGNSGFQISFEVKDSPRILCFKITCSSGTRSYEIESEVLLLNLDTIDGSDNGTVVGFKL